MLEEIKNAIIGPLQVEGMYVFDIVFGEEEGVKTLFITLDSEEKIDLDKIVKATEIINPIIDGLDLISDDYTLDISSKEKGEEENESEGI